MKKLILMSLFAWALLSANAQMYTPIDTANYALRVTENKKYLENVKNQYKEAKKEYFSGESKIFKKRYENINKIMTENILSGQYFLQSVFQPTIDSIKNDILTANPTLPKDLNFYLVRNNTMNASSLGNKYFTVNMGCFYYSENKDQLAAIICHEIAHYQLNHVLRDIQSEYAQKKEMSGNAEIFEIKNSSDNWGNKAYNRLKELLYKEGKKNQQEEFEADSMGYCLYKNTKYSKDEYINSFKNKESYDSIRPLGLNLETYKQVFHLPNQPFNDAWLKKEDFSKYDYSKFHEKYNEDSLSTHPETVLRTKALIKNFPELANCQSAKAPSVAYQTLSEIATYEQPCNFDFQEEYGLGVYFCLYRIQQNEHVDYYKNRLGAFFQKIYDARKGYKLNRYIDRIDPKNQSESYQQFLNFVWNLNVTEIKNIADFYTKKGS